jgi:hypothetical protein
MTDSLIHVHLELWRHGYAELSTPCSGENKDDKDKGQAFSQEHNSPAALREAFEHSDGGKQSRFDWVS